MPRRHDDLLPLTHDHHHALRNARMLRLAAEGDPAARPEVIESYLGGDLTSIERSGHSQTSGRTLWQSVAGRQSSKTLLEALFFLPVAASGA